MSTGTQTKKALVDLIDECIEFVDSTMKEAVDDANEVMQSVFDKYYHGEKHIGVPSWEAEFVTATVMHAFALALDVDLTWTVSIAENNDINEDMRDLTLMLDHHCSMWASACLRAKAKVFDTRHEIINRIGDTDSTKLLNHLRRLKGAAAAANRQLSRLKLTKLTGPCGLASTEVTTG